MPVAEKPSFGSGWCYIHRHSNTCLPKVGPLDWGILLPIQGSFACADNRCDKNARIRFGGVEDSINYIPSPGPWVLVTEYNLPFFSFSAEMSGTLYSILLWPAEQETEKTYKWELNCPGISDAAM